MADRPGRRFIGFNECWRMNSTGTRAFFLFWICVWNRDFVHSTALFE